jgi:hypothetical protein
MAKSPFEIVLSEEESRELGSRAARYTSVLSPDGRARVVAETHQKRVPNRVPE